LICVLLCVLICALIYAFNDIELLIWLRQWQVTDTDDSLTISLTTALTTALTAQPSL